MPARNPKLESGLPLALALIPIFFLAGCACAASLRPLASPETLTAAPQVEGNPDLGSRGANGSLFQRGDQLLRVRDGWQAGRAEADERLC